MKEAKQGPVSLLEDHSAENLFSHCSSLPFTVKPFCSPLLQACSLCDILAGGEAPGSGWQHSFPQSLVGELEGPQNWDGRPVWDDHSEDSLTDLSLLCSAVVLRKPTMLSFHCWCILDCPPEQLNRPASISVFFIHGAPSCLCIFVVLFMSTWMRFHFSSLLKRSVISSWDVLVPIRGAGWAEGTGRVFPPCARKLHQQGSFKGCCVTCFLWGVAAGLPSSWGLSFPCLLAHHLGPSSDKCCRIRRLPWILCEDIFSPPLSPPAPSQPTLLCTYFYHSLHLLSAFAIC